MKAFQLLATCVVAQYCDPGSRSKAAAAAPAVGDPPGHPSGDCLTQNQSPPEAGEAAADEDEAAASQIQSPPAHVDAAGSCWRVHHARTREPPDAAAAGVCSYCHSHCSSQTGVLLVTAAAAAAAAAQIQRNS